jgi:hypothetical protein
MATVQPALLGLALAAPKKAARKRRPKPQVADGAPVEYMSDVDGQGRRVWTLRFPAPALMKSVNSGNQHWRVTGPLHRTWREASFLHAKAAKLPAGLARVRIDVVLRFPRNGRIDAGNYYTHVVKPIVDGLGPPINKMRAGKRVTAVGYGLIPDDTAEYLDGPYPILGPKSDDTKRCPFGAVEIVITDLSDEVGGDG